MITTRQFAFVLGLFALLVIGGLIFQSQPTVAQDFDTTNYRKTMIQLLGATFDAARGRGIDLSVYDAVAESGDELYIAPLIDLAYFARSEELAPKVIETLATLTGETMDWRTRYCTPAIV